MCRNLSLLRCLFFWLAGGLLFSGAATHAAINPDEFLNFTTETVEVTVERVAVAGTAETTQTVTIAARVEDVRSSATGLKIGDRLSISYSHDFKSEQEKEDEMAKRPAGWTGPQNLTAPNAPAPGQRVIAYLSTERDEKTGQIRYFPGASQYSFVPAGWSSECALPLSAPNSFQFAKLPVRIADGDLRNYYARPDLTLDQAQRYQQAMTGTAGVICPTVFAHGCSEATLGDRTTSYTHQEELAFGGTNEQFTAVTPYRIAEGRNFTPKEIETGRAVVIIGQFVVATLSPSESTGKSWSMIGSLIKLNGRPYRVIGTFAEVGEEPGNAIAMIPLTRYLKDFGSKHCSLTIATQVADPKAYRETLAKATAALRAARGLTAKDGNDFEISAGENAH
jgi:hypothetical protein